MIWIKVDLASLMREITNEEDINNPNNVKWLWIKMDFVLFAFGNSVSKRKKWAFGTCNTSGFMRLENKHY
jgi:CMP-2-keto-3-deoxyoctulosonic acid synthetase